MVFWRKGFAGISDDKFNKDYRYNIRHNYGLEGKRQNYQPKKYVCLSDLLSGSPQVLTGPIQLPAHSHFRRARTSRCPRMSIPRFLGHEPSLHAHRQLRHQGSS